MTYLDRFGFTSIDERIQSSRVWCIKCHKEWEPGSGIHYKTCWNEPGGIPSESLLNAVFKE